MVDSEVHVGDIGSKLILAITDDGVAFDISTALVMKIRLQKPGSEKVVVEFTATLATDGTDGLMQYATTAAADLDVAGVWLIQGYIEMAGGEKWTSSKKEFQVHEVLVVS